MVSLFVENPQPFEPEHEPTSKAMVIFQEQNPSSTPEGEKTVEFKNPTPISSVRVTPVENIPSYDAPLTEDTKGKKKMLFGTEDSRLPDVETEEQPFPEIQTKPFPKIQANQPSTSVPSKQGESSLAYWP